MPIKKFYYKTVRFILNKFSTFLRIDNTTHSALFILRRISYLESRATTVKPVPIEKQVFFIFANRMIIDAQGAILLAQKGFYGTGYSITAMMLRNYTMYASLVSDKNRLVDFWNEDKDTYQNNPDFFDKFKEGAIRKTAKNKFRADAFERSELEKLMHGSCYAIRKYYSERKIDNTGKSYPLLRFGKFYDEIKEKGINSIVGGIILDFLGVFFTDYQDEGRNDYKEELKYYYAVIKIVQKEIKEQEKRLTEQGR